ncbi:hypothetical protein ACVBIO_14175 [Shewanella sp. 0m-8]
MTKQVIEVTRLPVFVWQCLRWITSQENNHSIIITLVWVCQKTP